MKKTLQVLATLVFILTLSISIDLQMPFSGPTPNSDGSVIDLDNDGLADNEEVALGSDPANPDTDRDGIASLFSDL